ncbi:hypothetical protein CBS63078_5900 [Aspergillus niger]|nr:hypothetical protein CBS115989_4155 [Aspergillus niger]KAI2841723.1 hypothetical protein CBS11350_6268 [Aspergillus niger]KAI2848987.1 hypothetical protein CBS11232_6678 [Aspergillus niger]KAI2880660.1 hypothetical protein CBS115988_1412 [Aspergillus niger]KAI2891176.1 hypothetical protein CBS11852_6179 [Aspergillus niger]
MPPTQPPEHFHGYLSHSPTTPLTYARYTPKPFTPHDIEISITHCGICGTDLHTLRSGWGPNTTTYPCIVGHEIIGIVTRIGSSIPTSPAYPNTTPLQIGDRVGIGAQTLSCLQPSCEECVAGKENYCPRITGTYNSRYWDNETGKRSDVIAYGGFARKWRGPAAFAFRIPEGLKSEVAAPLLCAGTTVFAPLRKYLDGNGKGKTVAVVGIGGLGHLGIMFAKALGCERVIGISRSNMKREDAVKGLGADGFIATGEEKGWEKKWSRSVDLILCTVDGDDMPLGKYLRLLKAGGTFVLVGAPEKPLPRMRAFELIGKGVNVTGSNIGSREDIRCNRIHRPRHVGISVSPLDFGPYVMQSTLLLVAPALFAASIYMELCQIIALVKWGELAIIRVGWMTNIFVAGDMLSFLMQVSGAGIMVNGSRSMGQQIIVGGLIVQIAFFSFFVVSALVVLACIASRPAEESRYPLIPWRKHMFALYSSRVLIIVRSVCRVVEYIEGSDGFLLQHEVFIYVLDGLLALSVLIVFAAIHPREVEWLLERGSTKTEKEGRIKGAYLCIVGAVVACKCPVIESMNHEMVS